MPLNSDPVLDFRGEKSVNYFSRYTHISIEADKVQYEPGDDVPVRFRITNTGYQIVRIYPTSVLNKSFQFMVLDPQGREIEARILKSADLRNRRVPEVINYQGEQIKEIILHPDETYEKVIYLNDLYPLEAGKEYRVSGYFYPDIRHEYFVRSGNSIKVRVARDRQRDFLTEEHGFQASSDKPSLTPEETVYLFLSAEIKKNWSNYLKYLHLNKYITSYDRYATRYAAASDMERSRIMKDFGDYLSGGRDETLKYFKIDGVSYDRSVNGKIISNGRAYVRVIAERDTRGFVERYEYTYSLEKYSDTDDFWKIVYVTARLLD